MIVLRELAAAKINLTLRITGKREDGYHLLDSWVAFADLGDKLEARTGREVTLAVEGKFAANVPQDNSVLRAAAFLRAHADVTEGAALTLHKHLPVAAGIGGGSADAAAALRLLTRFWKAKATPAALHEIAFRLGADVPACLHSSSVHMSGIGEVLEAGSELSGLHVVLANPGRTLATKDVFAAFGGGFSKPAERPQTLDSRDAIVEYLRRHPNDLQETAITLVPEIRTVLEVLSAEKDCLLARMSGSGATCFGLFANRARAEAAAGHIAARHSAWWVKAGGLK